MAFPPVKNIFRHAFTITTALALGAVFAHAANEYAPKEVPVWGNLRAELTKTTHPDGKTDTTEYDANGNVIQRCDRAGRCTGDGLDALDRVTAVARLTPIVLSTTAFIIRFRVGEPCFTPLPS